MKRKSKADQILVTIEETIKIGRKISWVIYRGSSVVEAKSIENYINGFFKTGNLMPIHFKDFGLDILTVNVEYDNIEKTTIISVEGIVQRLKGVEPHE